MHVSSIYLHYSIGSCRPCVHTLFYFSLIMSHMKVSVFLVCVVKLMLCPTIKYCLATPLMEEWHPEHPALYDPPDREGIQVGANEHQLCSNSSLAANAHQSRGIGGLEANVLQSAANPMVAGNHPTTEPVVGTSSSFDPNSLSTI